MESGISSAQFISINFEDLNFSHLQTTKSLHDEITRRAAEINGKVYLFFDEIQEVIDWEKCINSPLSSNPRLATPNTLAMLCATEGFSAKTNFIRFCSFPKN